MAVAHANTSILTGSVGSDPTGSHDSGSGSDRVAVLWGVVHDGGGAQDITGATLNGVPMTAMGPTVDNANVKARGFYLASPPTGSSTVTLSVSGAGGRAAAAIVSTYTGVDASTPIRGYVSDADGGTTAAIDVTSAAGDVVVAMAATYSLVTWAPGDGQTERADSQHSMSGDVSFAASEAAGAASVTMSHVADASVVWVTLGASLVPSAGGGPEPATSSNTFRRIFHQLWLN